jgi:hypothetical protein
VVIREMLCRAAKRTEVTVTFVANQFIRVEPSPYIKFIQVARGFDETSRRKGHSYITVAVDLEERRVIHVVKGKNAETIKETEVSYKFIRPPCVVERLR